MFSAEGYKVTAYMQLTKLFPRHVLPKLCQTALNEATDGISTTGIAAHIIAATGLDQGDRHLRKSIAYKVVQHMRRMERERKVVRLGKIKGAVLWRLV